MPCDGINDGCKDMTDEDCGTPHIIIFLLIVVGVTACMGISLSAFSVYCEPRMNLNCFYQQTAEPAVVERGSLIADYFNGGEEDAYETLRVRNEFGPALENLLVFLRDSVGLEEFQAASQKYYRLEKKFQGGDTDRVDLFYFHNFKTGEVTELFYSAVNDTATFRLRKLIAKKVPCILTKVISSPKFKKGLISVKTFSSVVMHYVDTAKDIYLVSKLVPMLFFGPSVDVNRIIILWVLCCIALTELGYLMSLVSHQEFRRLTRFGKTVCLLLFPLLPGLIRFRTAQVKHRKVDLTNELNKVARESANIQTIIEYENSLAASTRTEGFLEQLIAEFRWSEIVFEHVPILELYNTLLTTLQLAPELSINLLPEFISFIYISIILSHLSIIRGHLLYAEAFKGKLSLTGKLILGLFYLGSTTVVHPLSNCILNQNNLVRDYRSFSSNSDLVYDFFPNGTAIRFESLYNEKFSSFGKGDTLTAAGRGPAPLHIKWEKFSEMSFPEFLVYYFRSTFCSGEWLDSKVYASHVFCFPHPRPITPLVRSTKEQKLGPKIS